ncbi:MAG: response regulator [Bacteroidota bacterium]
MRRLLPELLSLRRNYILALAGIAILLLLSQVFIQTYIHTQGDDAYVINLAGKQRMLSQKLIKSLLASRQTTNNAGEHYWAVQTEETRLEWQKAHIWLKNIKTNPSFSTEKTRQMYQELQPYYEGIWNIVTDTDKEMETEEGNFEILFKLESEYLFRMNAIVQEYEILANARVERLKWIEIGFLFAAMLLLIVEAQYVYQPVIQRLNEAVLTRDRQNTLLQVKNDELIQARQEANIANEAKAAFLANITHEIRTPMNAIMGMGELLRMSQITEEQSELLDAIKVSTDDLMVIINDILDFSQIESAKLEIREVVCDLESIMENALTEIGPNANEKGLEIGLDWDPTIPKALILDKVQIRQVLIHLLGNALKFTQAGHILLSVKKTNETEDKICLEFHVVDTGIGIPKEKQGQILTPFHQADNSTTRSYGGTGLGLSISRHLVELMEGKLSFVSEEGSGSDFHFYIWAKKSTHDAKKLIDSASPIKDLNIWILEPHAVMRTCTEKWLHQWEVELSTFRNKDSLLAQAQQALRVPHAILVSQGLDDSEGKQIAKALGQLPKFTQIPLVLLSMNHAFPENEPTPFQHILHKPVKRQKMVEILKGIQHHGTVEEVDVHVSIRDLHILLAEDNMVSQKYMRKTFDHLGVKADIVGNGQQAYEANLYKKYDLILMDLQMPVMNGIEATETILMNDAPHKPPIIALTANTGPENHSACLAAGMVDFMTKPASPFQIEQMLIKWAKVIHSQSRSSMAK